MVALDPQLKIDASQIKALHGLMAASPTGKDLQVKALNEDILFVPFYAVGDQSYTTYLELA
jgi:hypothetical protein